ncbi:MAG: ribonuclease III [Deltaproteobacteria bacterium]|nr:ribonuclease III [Deltaproteobacteria bacterium]
MDKERIEALRDFSAILGYLFGDIALLDRALIHGSYANENPALAQGDNERLEFLGDAVLQLCMSDMLIERFPGYTEGQLSKARAFMVNDQSLAGLARRLRIGDFIRLGRGEEKAEGRNKDSILGNAFESLIGAIYLDGGYEVSRGFIRRVFQPLVEEWATQPVYQDYKSLLQEASQSRFREIPRYRIVSASGPDHDKTFEVEASIGNRIATTGNGKNKKEAEQDAARKVLEELEKP